MKVFETKKYFAMALDPIHIGTGGYRVGRVDNTIVREPATGIPKIPGTTIEGVCRSYAFLKLKETSANDKNLAKRLEEVKFNLQCAKGKAKGEGAEPCGKCPVCITFGYAKKEGALQAMALFSDARVLFFPVATMIGPVWITCPMVLRDAGTQGFPKPEKDKFIASKEISEFLSDKENNQDKPKFLNFGWLLLEQDKQNAVSDASQWEYKENKETRTLNETLTGYEAILNRVVIVPDNLFTTIVNSNLEVRTSVAIDPERGAAEEGALFTYEAIPRGTVFWFDVVYQNPKNFPKVMNNQNAMVKDIEGIVTTVENGLSLFEHLGIGGMSSRGFGRMRILNLGGDSDEQSNTR